jgi:hypothetical protein
MESERVFPQTDTEVDAAIQQEKDEHKQIQEQALKAMAEHDPAKPSILEEEIHEVKPTHLKVFVTEDDDNCDICDEEAESGSDEEPEIKPKKGKKHARADRKCQECVSVLTRRDLGCCVCKETFVCEQCCGAGFVDDTCISCRCPPKKQKIKKDKPARLGTKRPIIVIERRRRVFHPAVHMLEVNGLHYPLLHTDTDAERFVKPGVVRLCTAARKHESQGVSSKTKRFDVSVSSALVNRPIELELEGNQMAEGVSFVNHKHDVSMFLVKGAKDMMHPLEVHVPISMLHADDPALTVATKSQ